MLVSEFIDRTGYQPSADEYAEIEQAYYVFEGDKDKFCKAWVKANPHKAGKLWAAIKEQKRLSKVFDNVLRYVMKVKTEKDWWYDLSYRDWQEYCNTMSKVCKCKDRSELRDMVRQLKKASAVTTNWSSNRWSYFYRLEQYV